MLKGRRKCGGVTFEIADEPTPPSLCHLGQGRRQSGPVWALAHSFGDSLTLTAQTSLRRFKSGPGMRRGFCGDCGAFLYRKNQAETEISLAMGAIDAATGQRLVRHIFGAARGDCHDIADNLPQRA